MATCEDYTKFKLIKNIGDSLVSSELVTNLKAYLDWSFLGIGGWTNAGVVDGGDFRVMRASDDKAYNDGQVFEGARKDWVWETGVNYQFETNGTYELAANGFSPTGVHIVLGSEREVTELALASGDTITLSSSATSALNGIYTVIGTSDDHIWTNSSLLSSSAGGNFSVVKTYNPVQPTVTVNDVAYTGSYDVDYTNGRIIFATGIDVDDSVEVVHSYRDIQVYRDGDALWLKDLQSNSMRIDSEQFSQRTQGEWAVGPHKRVQMPCIVIEAVERADTGPFQIGSANLKVNHDVHFHILAETKWQRDQLSDVILLQTFKTIYLFDTNELHRKNKFPLTEKNDLVDNPMMYPDLVALPPAGFRRCECRFKSASKMSVTQVNSKLYMGLVRVTFEINV